MGNSLCKERHDRSNHKNQRPVQRVLGSCPQVFAVGNKENVKWPNHVLETRPPASEPESSPGEWKNVTLRPMQQPSIVTLDQPSAKTITLPIVPPRRKKTEKLLKSGKPGGFKEVFGNVTRRSSCDSVKSSDRSIPPLKRRSSGSDLTNASNETVEAAEGAVDSKKSKLVRKISKVGNRKSDQFFGENLSDCLSDEPVVTVAPVKSEMMDEIDAFINSAATSNDLNRSVPPNSNVTDDVDDIAPPVPSRREIVTEMPSLNKKAEFLMAMLDEYNNDANLYANKRPVEEPIIVPKRKHGRHICDDHERLKIAIAPSDVVFEKAVDATNTKPKISNASIQSSISGNEMQSPQKPQRDFAKYRESVENLNKTPPANSESPNAEKIFNYKNTSSVSRESLPTPPPRPTKTLPIELPVLDQLTPPLKMNVSTSDHQLKTDHINQSLYNDKLDTVLKKCNSSHSFLTPDLMDQIVNKVYGFQMNWDDHDAVHASGYDDCSGQVAPSSKLKTRKISVIRKDQITEKPIIEEPSVELEKSDASVHDINKSESEVDNNQLTTKPTIEAKESNFSIGNVSIKLSPQSQSTNKSDNKSEKSQTSKTLPIKDTSDKVEEDLNSEVTKSVQSITENLKNDAKVSTVIVDRKPFANTESDLSSLVIKSDETLSNFFDIHPDEIKSSTPIKAVQQHSYEPNVIKKSDTVLEIQRLAKTGDAKTDDDVKTSETDILDEIYTHNRSRINSFHKSLNRDSKIDSKNKTNSYTDSADSNVTNVATDRRDSIVDHDEWFNEGPHHIAKDDHSIRRESETLSYDTSKVFPFGKRETSVSDSLSSEFFCPNQDIDTKNNNILSVTLDDSNNDHSTLLKYLPSPTK